MQKGLSLEPSQTSAFSLITAHLGLVETKNFLEVIYILMSFQLNCTHNNFAHLAQNILQLSALFATLLWWEQKQRLDVLIHSSFKLKTLNDFLKTFFPTSQLG